MSSTAIEITDDRPPKTQTGKVTPLFTAYDEQKLCCDWVVAN
ncbi:MAG: hypothetical protein SWZ49_31575 [Cyanobacteriota bacterium]|nr:hypothetical protein [Cyanobacteriota bacterium]